MTRLDTAAASRDVRANHNNGIFWPLFAPLTLLALLGPSFPSLDFFRESRSYLYLHTGLESASVIVAITITLLALARLRLFTDHVATLLGAGMLSTALLDVGHILSYNGMPAMVTPSSPEKAIYFWLAARSMVALSLAGVVLLVWKGFNFHRHRLVIYSVAVVLVVVCYQSILFQPEQLPAMWIAGSGLTPLKVAYEWGLIVVFAVSAAGFWWLYQQRGESHLLQLAMATWLFALAEVFFTLYSDVTDLHNLLGHGYKIIADAFVLRAVFQLQILTPYQTLTRTQQELSLILDHSNDIIFHKQLQPPRITYISPACESILGYKQEAFYTDDDLVDRISHPEDLDKLKMLRGSDFSSTRFEYRFIHHDGQTVWVDINFSAIHDEAGLISGYQGVARDISKRKAIEQEKDTSNERFSALVRTSPLGIYMCNLDGEMLYQNDQISQITGFPLSRSEGKGWHDIIHPEDLGRFLEQIRINIEFKKSRWTSEFRIIHRNGDTHWLINYMSLMQDSDGEPFALMGALSDFTEERSIKLKHEYNENMLRSVIASMAEGLVVQDEKGNIVECNEAAEAILGLTRDQIMGRDSMDPRWQAIYSDGRPFPGERHPAMVALQTGRVQRDVVMGLLWIDETTHWISINATPIRNAANAITSVVTTFRDITEEEQLRTLIEEQKQNLELAQQIAKSGSFVWDLRTDRTYLSPSLYQILHITGRINSLTAHLISTVARHDRRRIIRILRKLAAQGGEFDFEYAANLSFRRTHYIHVKGTLVRDIEKQIIRVWGIVQDITERKELENHILEQKQAYQSLLDYSASGIYGVDADGICTFINPTGLALLGYDSAEELIGKYMHEQIHHHRDDNEIYPGDQCPIYRTLKSGEVVVVDSELFWRKDGTSFPVEYRAHPIMEHETISGVVVNFMDISARKQRENELSFRAQHDPLTQLYNRNSLEQLLENTIDEARQSGRGFALLFADLNDFKPINDQYGHKVGDQILIEVAARIESRIRKSDLPFRYGGDEFIIVLPGIDQGSDAQQTAEEIVEAIHRPITAGDHSLQVGISIGIALFPQHGGDANTLLKVADETMYQVKNQTPTSAMPVGLAPTD